MPQFARPWFFISNIKYFLFRGVGGIPAWHQKESNSTTSGIRWRSPEAVSDHKLWNFFVSKIQREIFAGPFDGESILDVDALLGQAAVAVESLICQSVATAKRVALSCLLAQAGQVKEVFLVEPDVIQAQAVSVGGGFWLSADCLWNTRRQNKHRLDG